MKDSCDIFVDGVFTLAIQEDEDIEPVYEKLIPRGSYKEIVSSSGGYSGYRVYFSETELKARTIAWKTNSGFRDKDGNALYYSDSVIDDMGQKGTVSMKSDGWDYRTDKQLNKRYVVEFYQNSVFSKTLTDEYAKTLKKIDEM